MVRDDWHEQYRVIDMLNYHFIRYKENSSLTTLKMHLVKQYIRDKNIVVLSVLACTQIKFNAKHSLYPEMCNNLKIYDLLILCHFILILYDALY